jgi:hypothetical protein
MKEIVNNKNRDIAKEAVRLASLVWLSQHSVEPRAHVYVLIGGYGI